MALADEIRALRDRVLLDLNAAHDYSADTKTIWDIVRRVVPAGQTLTVRNMTTGNREGLKPEADPDEEQL